MMKRKKNKENKIKDELNKPTNETPFKPIASIASHIHTSINVVKDGLQHHKIFTSEPYSFQRQWH